MNHPRYKSRRTSGARPWMLAALIAVFFVWLYAEQLSPPTQRTDTQRGNASPCFDTLTWSIGTVDRRFNLSRDELAQAVEAATSVWEGAAQRPIFEHAENGRISVNLVYDERQEDFLARRRLERELQGLQSEIGRLEAARDAQRADYESGLYSPAVSENIRQRFDELTRTLQHSLERYNAGVAELNDAGFRERALFSGTFARNRALVRGDIDVFQFYDSTDLALVLAHEFGHAMGLSHVQEPEAIMYWDDSSFGPSRPLQAHDGDVRAWRQRCS